MKLKYYLNGFGIGILFATIILSVSFLIRSDSGTKMTDEEVMARARQLGMEMTTAAVETEPPARPEKPSETESSREPETTEEPTAEETTTQEPTTEASTTEEPTTEAPTTEPPTTEEPTTEPPTTQEPTTQMQAETQPVTTVQSGEGITIEISSGMTSESVSQMLADNRIISSAPDLNTYMVQTGKAGKIRVGRYEMTQGMSYDEIVSMICR